MKARTEEGEVEGRKRGNVQVMPGPDRWSKQSMGLVVVAIEVEACRLRPEALPRGSLSGEQRRNLIIRRAVSKAKFSLTRAAFHTNRLAGIGRFLYSVKAKEANDHG
jgi:hypothetical protein